MRKFAILCSLVLISPVLAQGLVIDNFDDGNISDWQISADPSHTQLDTGDGYLGYAIELSGSGYDITNDAYRHEIGIDLPNTFGNYNLSLWYYRNSVDGVCVGSSEYDEFEIRVYVSTDDDECNGCDWTVFEFQLDEGCDRWILLNQAFDTSSYNQARVDPDTDNHLGTIGLVIYTTGTSSILFDELMIVPETSAGPSCDEYWKCTDWRACGVGNTQQRICTDENSCGTDFYKPSETRACTCVNYWTCTSWSLCLLGSQGRTCSDLNSCGVSDGRPEESQTCALWEPLAVLGVALVVSGFLKFRKMKEKPKPKKRRKKK